MAPRAAAEKLPQAAAEDSSKLLTERALFENIQQVG